MNEGFNTYQSPTNYDLSTFQARLAYDRYENAGAFALQYALFSSYLMDNTMELANIRVEAYTLADMINPYNQYGVTTNSTIIGRNKPPDAKKRLAGHFFQVQWKILETDIISNGAPTVGGPNAPITAAKMIRGRDTLFGVNFLGDNTGDRVSSGDVQDASELEWPNTTPGDFARPLVLNDLLNLLASLGVCSYTTRFLTPHWTTSGNRTVIPTLYHGRSKRHAKRKNF
jgi:hypothetical protein